MDTSYWAVLDWNRELARIESEEDLERTLREVPAQASSPNAIVNIWSPTGDVLSVGISDGLACMNFTGSSGDPPYYKVVGHPELSPQDGVIVFRYEGQWTEIPKRNCVPVQVMIRGAKDFYRTGELPEWLEWEEV